MRSERLSTALDMLAACVRHVAASAAGLLTIPLVAHTLGADSLGLWAILGTSSFLLGVSDLGLGVVVQRATVRRDEDAMRRSVGLTLTSVALVGPPLAALTHWFALDFPSAGLARDLALCSGVVLAAGLVQSWGSAYRALLVASGKMQALAFARVLSSVLQVALTALGLMWRGTLLAPSVALLVALSVEVVLWVRAARGSFPSLPLLPLLPRDSNEVKSALREGAAALAINAAGLLALRIDVMLLSKVSPLAAVAAYGVASRAVDQSFTVAKQVSSALLPKLGDPAARARAVRTGTAVLGALVASGMAVLSAAGSPLLVAWAGSAAMDPALAIGLPLLATAAFISAHHETAAASLLLSGKTGWDAATPLVAGYVVNIAISAGLVWSAGVWAVAGGTLIGTTLSSLLLWSRARALLGWSLASVTRALLPGAAAGAVALAIALGLRGPALAGWLPSMMLCAGAGLMGLASAALVARRVA